MENLGQSVEQTMIRLQQHWDRNPDPEYRRLAAERQEACPHTQASGAPAVFECGLCVICGAWTKGKQS